MKLDTKDPNSFHISLDNIFENQELKNAFHSYLKKIHNEEHFLFLMQLEKYITYVGNVTRFKAAKKIVEEFLEAESPHEVNVSSDLREKVIARVPLHTEEKCPSDLFDDIRASVYLEMKQNCLSGFLSSTTFKEHIESNLKHNPEYLLTIGSLIQYDPNKPEVSDEDFEAQLKYFQDESLWEVMPSNTPYTKSITKKEDSRGYKNLRISYVVPFNREEMFNVMKCSPCSKEIDMTHNMERTYFGAFENGKYLNTKELIVVNYPFPLSNRCFTCVSSVRREKDGSIFFIAKSADLPNIPTNKKHVKGDLMQAQMYEDIGGGFCKYTFVVLYEMSGASPAVMTKILSASIRDDDHYNLVVKCGQERAEKGITTSEGPIAECLRYFDKFNKDKKL
ncbi:regulator of G-protein signaling [Acrasis kona]|uniref:Regulator of G-protein signaling n=1 Tax=Acrasis kona TaxID=1008807 RepID=A0AAW2YKW1_9EUKA